MCLMNGGIKHSLCLISIESNAHPSESMAIKKSCFLLIRSSGLLTSTDSSMKLHDPVRRLIQEPPLLLDWVRDLTSQTFNDRPEAHTSAASDLRRSASASPGECGRRRSAD